MPETEFTDDWAHNRISAIAYFDFAVNWFKKASTMFIKCDHHSFRKEFIQDLERHSKQLQDIADLLKKNKV